jgi:hypothetical protein
MQKKIIVSLLGASTLFLTYNLQASEVKWADPLPNTPAVKASDAVPAVPATATTPEIPANPAVAAKPATGGIGYEWTVTLGNNDSAEFVGTVGAKSSYEPTFKAPEFAWQHTSNWVALDLTADATITITVNAQQGLRDFSVDSTTKALVIKDAGKFLKPVVSVFKNWEETGVETGSFNPMGKTSWMNELVFIGIAYADKGQSVIAYTAKLAKGKYSLNIGGANAYEPNGCAATDATCYTGNHGYRVSIITG